MEFVQVELFSPTKVQIDNIAHALGLERKKKPYRNYYNTGSQINPNWEALVEKGYATRRDTSKEMGGYYYHLTLKGFQLVIDNPDLFNIDKRIRYATTIEWLVEK